MTPTSKSAKDRIREWYVEISGGRDPALELHLTTLSEYALRPDFGEVQIQVEINGRAAFWPRSMFELDWPAAERELHRFFIEGPAREQRALGQQNGWSRNPALTDGEHDALQSEPELRTLHEDD